MDALEAVEWPQPHLRREVATPDAVGALVQERRKRGRLAIVGLCESAATRQHHGWAEFLLIEVLNAAARAVGIAEGSFICASSSEGERLDRRTRSLSDRRQDAPCGSRLAVRSQPAAVAAD